ncbi:FeoB-associated Cys-rich membrane protein [Paenibacillus sp. N1-5-1-14]|uniref:FeoB-associated Cys-rich membrane protein n=1 Tax=Paenibacillus radicibacter TaxID=2972488 RepID=UPI0021591A37|nr:FeoB-associated Cys-rich membrane protein [Paenibacillus radicibacter]MCR8642477.1 FeoB-associated Cys-rich membrane protein [Paenibacillus radicibacter]
MAASIILGTVIFGYAAWTLVRFYKKSKQGKCAGCSIAKTCQSSCSSTIQPNQPNGPA